MNLLPIDELNTPEIDVDEFLDDYFESFPGTEEQKEKRKDAAKSVRNAMLFLFSLMAVMAASEYADMEYLLAQFRQEFRDAISPYVRIDGYIEDYIQRETDRLVTVTLDHIDTAYYTSDERALYVGANEASSAVGYEELQEAIENGYTKKEWVTQKDNRVRHTHREAEGQVRDIDDYFVVGGVAMMIPCDPDCMVVEEVANCRCGVRFS
jgi:uncharacterized protein with gpF-like domain